MTATADGYIRVSRRAGREGDSFISPALQRERIAGWAALHGVEIVEWWEEIDQSGAKRERPKFQEALARCERGETGGIVVARLDRFARSAIDALESIKRLNEAGARLVSVEDNFDGSTPMGRFAIGILTLIAELELERIKENWSSAVRSAVERGVHISSTPPAGYRRDETRRLVAVEPDASVIREVFRRRANGASRTSLADFLAERGVRTSKGSPRWSTTGVMAVIRNRVYLGEARSGSVVNAKAHEAIVTEAEFQAAQGSRTLLSKRDGSVASQALLGGLARCAGCGHTLKITGGTDKKTGARYPIYYCIRRYAKGICPAPATVRASHLDRYVEEQVLAALSAEDGLLAQAVEASTELEEAQRRLEQAEHELDQFVTDTTLLSLLGKKKFLQGVEARQRAFEQARAELGTLKARSELPVELTSGDLLQAWPGLSVEEKRRLLHGLLDRVLLRRADRRVKYASPTVPARTQIILRGNVLLGNNPDESTQPRVA